jgi:hypothetical protein
VAGASAVVTSEPGGADPAEVAAARDLIEATDLSDDGTVAGVDGIRFTPAGAAAAAEVLAAGATGDARWAGAWVYATSGRDPAPLLALLDDEDPSIRAIAAAGALARGERDAAPVLAGLVANETELRGSDPPLTIGEYATAMLERLVDGPDVTAGASPRDRAAAWTAWLADHAATMQLDPATGRWSGA